jgi:hypothetical protein
MLSTKRLLLLVALVAAIAWSPLSNTRALGQEKTPDAAKADSPEEKKVDPFVVPDGTAAELVEYLESLKKLRPSPRDRRAYMTFIVKSSKPRTRFLPTKRPRKNRKSLPPRQNSAL